MHSFYEKVTLLFETFHKYRYNNIKYVRTLETCFVHVILGAGLPSAAQLSVNGSPRDTTRDLGCSKTLGELPQEPGGRRIMVFVRTGVYSSSCVTKLKIYYNES